MADPLAPRPEQTIHGAPDDPEPHYLRPSPAGHPADRWTTSAFQPRGPRDGRTSNRTPEGLPIP